MARIFGYTDNVQENKQETDPELRKDEFICLFAFRDPVQNTKEKDTCKNINGFIGLFSLVETVEVALEREGFGYRNDKSKCT